VDPVTVYSVIYSLCAFIIVFPSHEVRSAGLTIENLFSGYLGDQNLTFVLYQLRRVALTKCIHSALPTIYIFGLVLLQYRTSSSASGAFDYLYAIITLSKSSYLEILFITLSLGLLVYVFTSRLVSVMNDWNLDDLAITLAAHSTRGSWREVAVSIDTEIRRIDKFRSVIGSTTLYVTDTWLIQVSTYGVDVMQQSDVMLDLCKAEDFTLSPESRTGTQFLEIKVTSRRNSDHEFRIRLNSFDFRDLKDKLQAPVQNARKILIQQSLSEKFIQAFYETASGNPKYRMNDDDEAEQCIGCMQSSANVKLDKLCADEADGSSECSRCFCRPMWCVSCMARWFASRQEESSPETWLQGTSPCPTCRARFCLLDVMLLME